MSCNGRPVRKPFQRSPVSSGDLKTNALRLYLATIGGAARPVLSRIPTFRVLCSLTSARPANHALRGFLSYVTCRFGGLGGGLCFGRDPVVEPVYAANAGARG